MLIFSFKFFTGVCQKTREKQLRERLFVFHKNFMASILKFRHFEISDTRVHIFFQRIFTASVAKFRSLAISDIRGHIFFHQNLLVSLPKFRHLEISDTRAHILRHLHPNSGAFKFQILEHISFFFHSIQILECVSFFSMSSPAERLTKFSFLLHVTFSSFVFFKQITSS